VFLVAPENYTKVNISSRGILCQGEIDGLKIISHKRNEIIRHIP